MKLEDLKEINELAELLRHVQKSYLEQFKNKRNSLRLLISRKDGGIADDAPTAWLDLDLTLEGPIAALVDQAYRRKIEELKKRLQELGVDQEDKEDW